MSGGSRFTVDLGRERLVVCDRRPPLVDGQPASCRWGAPGLWRTVRTAAGVRAVFELPRPQERDADPVAVARQRRGRRGPRLRRLQLEQLLAGLTSTLGTGGSRGPSESEENRGTPGTPASSGSTLPSSGLHGPALGEAALDWAMATADGGLAAEVRADWNPLDAGSAADVAADGGRRWMSGPEGPVQSRLLWDSDRVAVVVPVLAEIPRRLSAARRGWAEALCLEARSEWVLVRMVTRSRDLPSRGRAASCVAAEVDLTGAPPALLPRLVTEARAALSMAVERLEGRLGLVLDPRVTSRLLARRPEGLHAPSLPSSTVPGEVSGAASSLRPRQNLLPW